MTAWDTQRPAEECSLVWLAPSRCPAQGRPRSVARTSTRLAHHSCLTPRHTLSLSTRPGSVTTRTRRSRMFAPQPCHHLPPSSLPNRQTDTTPAKASPSPPLAPHPSRSNAKSSTKKRPSAQAAPTAASQATSPRGPSCSPTRSTTRSQQPRAAPFPQSSRPLGGLARSRPTRQPTTQTW